MNVASNRNVLVETVHERKGFRFEPIPQTAEEIAAKAEQTFRKVPILIPVGVMVGVNDIANGVGCIRTGWSRCKLPPAIQPPSIPAEYMPFLNKTGVRKLHAAKAAHAKAVKNSDEWTMERGMAFAMQNLLIPSPVPTGRGFARKYAAFQTRCNRYFKDVEWTLVNNVAVRNPMYQRPAPKVTPASLLGIGSPRTGNGKAAQLKMLFNMLGGEEGVKQMMKIAPIPGLTEQQVIDILSGKVQLPERKPGAICNCPICTEMRQKAKGMGGNIAPAMPNIPLPPELQQIVRALEKIVGPVKIVGAVRL
jgi:hypothetical protein